MKEYAFIKLDYDIDNNFYAICEAHRILCTRIIDDMTNCIKDLDYYDIITGKKIKVDDRTRHFTGLSYSEGEKNVTRRDIIDALKTVNVQEYVNHIAEVKRNSIAIRRIKSKIHKLDK